MLHELLDNTYAFKSLSTVKNEFNLKWTFLDYLRIIQTIPYRWKQILTNKTCEKETSSTQLKKLKKLHTLKTKDIYWMLLPDEHDMTTLPNPMLYWIEKYKLSENNVKSVYTLPYIATKVTYIQTLQYKILYKMINCNYWLNKIKILDSDKCRFCTEVETVEHFFFGCKETKLFWK